MSTTAKKLGILHTSFALVAPLGELTRTMLPGVEVLNLVDDQLLAYARARGVDPFLTRRVCHYMLLAQEYGVDAILNACSSVGEAADVARSLVDVPIVKIDEPMAEQAVQRGERIGVLATVASTLGPTQRLIERTAARTGRTVQVEPALCDGAFDLLMAGQTERHDAMVMEHIAALRDRCDVVVLAQASMARLEPAVPAGGTPVLTSPRLAMERLRELLLGRAAA